jgi:hypothetical protein
MSRGPRISKTVEKLIVHRSLADRNTPRRVLAVELQETISKMSEPVPTEETLEKLISKARNHTPSPLDEQWTTASLVDFDLPPDSVPAVTKVWRYALNTNESFAIRQAKWVARLYTLIKETSLLWFFSRKYADEERTASITGQQMDTFIPDTALFMGRWETNTLLYTGYREGKLPKTSYDQILFRAKDGRIAEELLHGIEHAGIQFQNDSENSRDYELSKLIQELPSLDLIDFTQEARMVYLRWFTYLIKGPKWNRLSAQDALSITKRLRYWVLEQQKREHQSTPSFIKEYPTPDELLEEVGYKPIKED